MMYTILRFTKYFLLLAAIALSGCGDKNTSKVCNSYFDSVIGASIVEIKSSWTCFQGKEVKVYGYLKVEDYGTPYASYALYDTILAAAYLDLGKQLVVNLDKDDIDKITSLLPDRTIVFVSIKGKFVAPYTIKDVSDLWFTDNIVNLKEP